MLTRGDHANTIGPNAEPVTIVRAEYLNHPAYGTTPACRERWLHVRFADGGRVLMHPSNLTAA